MKIKGVLTVSKLLELCLDEYKKGNGDKQIIISDDPEGNGYHELFFGFTPYDEIKDSLYNPTDWDGSDTIVLG